MPPRIVSQSYPHKLDLFGTLVGLDLSLTSTGVAIITPRELITHRLKSDPLRETDRLNWIAQVVAPLCVGAHAIAIEGYAFGAKSNAHSIGELGGVIKLTLTRLGHKPYILPPMSLKKFVTGDGQAKGKGPLMLALYKRWGFTVEEDDQADATGLALFAGYASGHLPKSDLTAAQKTTFEKAVQVGMSTPLVRARSREKVQPVAT